MQYFTGWSCSHSPQLGWKDTKQKSNFCCCGKWGRDPKRHLFSLPPSSLIIFADLSSRHGVWMYWSHSADEGSYATAVCGNCKHSQCGTKNHRGWGSIWRTYRNRYQCVHKTDRLWQCAQCVVTSNTCYRGPRVQLGNAAWPGHPGTQIKWYARALQAKERWQQGAVLTIKNTPEFQSDITQAFDQQHSFVFPAF